MLNNSESCDCMSKSASSSDEYCITNHCGASLLLSFKYYMAALYLRGGVRHNGAGLWAASSHQYSVLLLVLAVVLSEAVGLMNVPKSKRVFIRTFQAISRRSFCKIYQEVIGKYSARRRCVLQFHY